MCSAQPTLSLQVITTSLAVELIEGLSVWQKIRLLDDRGSHLQITVNKKVQPRLQLTLETDSNQSQVLDGLKAWSEIGLLQNTKIICEVIVSADHPNLLVGLEDWLKRGLLKEDEIKELATTYLTSQLSEPFNQARLIATAKESHRPKVVFSEELFPSDLSVDSRPLPKIPPRESSRIQQIAQSLLAELSVLWLLLLGVFMVVVSSGFLAANQWERFSPSGQYGILWLYTLAFWGATFWATRQPHLRLTASALRIVTLLALLNEGMN